MDMKRVTKLLLGLVVLCVGAVYIYATSKGKEETKTEASTEDSGLKLDKTDASDVTDTKEPEGDSEQDSALGAEAADEDEAVSSNTTEYVQATSVYLETEGIPGQSGSVQIYTENPEEYIVTESKIYEQENIPNINVHHDTIDMTDVYIKTRTDILNETVSKPTEQSVSCGQSEVKRYE